MFFLYSLHSLLSFFPLYLHNVSPCFISCFPFFSLPYFTPSLFLSLLYSFMFLFLSVLPCFPAYSGSASFLILLSFLFYSSFFRFPLSPFSFLFFTSFVLFRTSIQVPFLVFKLTSPPTSPLPKWCARDRHTCPSIVCYLHIAASDNWKMSRYRQAIQRWCKIGATRVLMIRNHFSLVTNM